MSLARVRLRSLATVALVASLAAMPQPASASNDGLPDGSWRQACRDAYVRDGVLYAQCRRDDGRYGTASARVASCRAFGSRNGQLFCETPDSASGGASGWGGSFRETCSDISVDKHGKLKANCRKDNGTYQSTNLSMWKCPYRRAANRDGRLVCETSGGASGGVGRWEGSFRNSCRDISSDSAGTLTATCQAANGSWHRSSLALRQCSGYRAGNQDGTLFCESPDGGGASVRQWDGSFRNSCRDISSDSAGTLTATCQAANGSWHRSSLSLRQCSSHRAGNQDGTLFCESSDSGNVGGHQWQGSFRQSCRDISSDSAGTLTATCQAANGSWHRSSLSLRQCSSHRAGNRDGNLFCEG